MITVWVLTVNLLVEEDIQVVDQREFKELTECVAASRAVIEANEQSGKPEEKGLMSASCTPKSQ